jgi:xanthine/CO dehydrogenase XdhC/CoxF family maturation factor
VTASSPHPGADPLAEATRRLEEGEEVVLATAIRTDGAPPCRPGQKLLLGANGPLAGTLGCSEFDASAVDETKELLAAGEPALRTFTHDLGTVEVYLEPLRPGPGSWYWGRRQWPSTCCGAGRSWATPPSWSRAGRSG